MTQDLTRSPWKKVLLLVGGAILLLYPFVLHFCLEVFEPRLISLVLLLLTLGRLWIADKATDIRFLHLRPILWIIACSLTLSLIFNESSYLLINPALTFIALAIFFGSTFFFPPNFAHRMALVDFPEGLPPAAKTYCIWVTSAWVGFFVLCATVSLWSAFFAPKYVWTLFNGIFVWIFMGAFFAIEYFIRLRMKPVFEESKQKMGLS